MANDTAVTFAARPRNYEREARRAAVAAVPAGSEHPLFQAKVRELMTA